MRVVAELTGLLDRDPHGVDAAHLPAPIPIVCRPRASTIPFDETCLHTRQAKSRSAHALSGTSPHDDAPSPRAPRVDVSVLDEQPAEDAPEVPLARRVLAPLAVPGGCEAPASARAPRAHRGAYPGAKSTSTKCSAIRSPSVPVTVAVPGRRRSRRPRSGRRRARAPRPPRSSSATATPHGFPCLTITTRRLGQLAGQRGVRLRGRRGCCTTAPCRRAARRARADAYARLPPQ